MTLLFLSLTKIPSYCVYTILHSLSFMEFIKKNQKKVKTSLIAGRNQGISHQEFRPRACPIHYEFNPYRNQTNSHIINLFLFPFLFLSENSLVKVDSYMYSCT